MRTFRRFGVAAVACVALGGVAAPAFAQEQELVSAESYLGNAAGKALHLKVASTELTSGLSSARVDSTLKAVADSAGALGLPVLGDGNAGTVTVTADNQSESTGRVCGSPSLPAALATVVNIEVACSESSVSIKDGLPTAAALGEVVAVNVDAQTVLANLPLNTDTLAPVLAVVSGVEGTLQEQVDAINELLPTDVPDLHVTDTVGDLLDALNSTRTLEVRLGASTSEVTATADSVHSVATSNAGSISILPLGAQAVLPDGTVQLRPVAEIIIGSSKAEATYTRSGGKAVPSFDPAIATIRINTPTTDELGNVVGLDLREVKIGPDLSLIGDVGLEGVVQQCANSTNEFCILEGTPFETRLTVAGGRTITNPDGTVMAQADAVKIHALRNIGTLVAPLEGGLLLELASAQAGVGGQSAEFRTVLPETPDLPRELPRTGGFPFLPLAGAGLLSLGAWARRTLRQN